MGTILNQLEGSTPEKPVRCPLCGRGNTTMSHCRHVRWTFDQGGPLEFARHAVEVSPYTAGRGYSAADISATWLTTHGEKLMEMIDLHFGIDEGFVFGELVDIDILARDIWRMAKPEQVTEDALT